MWIMYVDWLLAAPWLVLAPLNFVKVLINKPSPLAHHFVAKRSEECQKTCEIARMWATMFWSLQFFLSLGLALSHRPRWMFASGKLFIGAILLFNFYNGVVKEPIAAAGCFEILSALVLASTSFPEKTKVE
eukprot:CAMPEP_0114522684 /NCGR_PEP_ID=MMETSP0109-20121206/20874_1 /TAXON_ID=29199 /ORGANISM="Chlorarachnion reptans, Strain CCCM449" /LENGTH=130 /DNA_ID=CAMNT_0001703919 /DNA_START=90 /DNA_END=482 /DNA_ORIENTATION=-